MLVERSFYPILTDALGEGVPVFYAIPYDETPLPFVVYYCAIQPQQLREEGTLQVDVWASSGNEALTICESLQAIQGNHTGFALVGAGRNAIPDDSAAHIECYFNIQ